MEELLTYFGLSDNETKVYIALLEHGAIKVSLLAQLVGIKRTSCHEYLRSLMQKGLINRSRHANTDLYQAEDPAILLQRINERTVLVKDLAQKLKKLQSREEWRARTLTNTDYKKIIYNAHKKQRQMLEITEQDVNLTIIDPQTLLLSSKESDIPLIEITSGKLVNFHKQLLSKAR